MLHRKLMLIVIILIFFLFIAGIISDNILIKDREKISVIVKLKEPKKDSNLLQGFVVYDGLSSLDKKYYYSSTDSYLVSIDKDRLEALKNNKNIEFIYEEQIYHAALQDALPLSNITIVHESFNLTGKNQAICILDTGINYSHNDFGSCSEIDFLSGNCTKIISGYDFVNDDNNPYDDSGHGTHVSGIVSRTAPDAKIISVKVLDENGDGSSSVINAGIDFCINNKEKYNISIISMSLGGGLYSNYCNNEPLKPFVNAALEKNITVVASAGNDFSKSKITGPACIYGVTSVSALNKDNSIASYSNRNKNTVIMAIGSNINSTSISGDYETMTGTSMSTPLVSGVIALLNQYQYENFNKILTPEEISLLLKNQGNNITDSTGVNYSRLNAYKLLNIESMEINETNVSIENPVLVSLVSPVNNSVANISNVTFECSSFSNSSLANISLYLGNSTSFENRETKEISGNINTSIFSINLTNNNYIWNCQSFNNLSVSNFSSENFSVTVNISESINLTNVPAQENNISNVTNTSNNQNSNTDSGSGSSGSSGSEGSSSESTTNEPQAVQLAAIETEESENNQEIQYKASQENNEKETSQSNNLLENQTSQIIKQKQGFFSNLMTGQAVSIGSNFSIGRIYITIFLILIIISALSFIIFKIRKGKNK